VFGTFINHTNNKDGGLPEASTRLVPIMRYGCSGSSPREGSLIKSADARRAPGTPTGTGSKRGCRVGRRLRAYVDVSEYGI
jgi:hypothetical protein